MRISLLCEDSLEGIFSAIYYAYKEKFNHSETELIVGEPYNYNLFTTYLHVDNNNLYAGKVAKTIIREFGTDSYEYFCKAAASIEENKADCIYHVIAKGLNMNNHRLIFDELGDHYVMELFKMSRFVNNELLHLKGFLRFKELSNGILYSEISPKNNIVTLLTPHFANRFPNENFVINDLERMIVTIHPAHKEWICVSGEALDEVFTHGFSENEYEYQKLFKIFHETIAIKDRANKKLQTQMLPLRFRDYMSEFST